MKKSLILLSLILSTASFAAVSNAENTKINGSMNITAEVIKPLTITAKGDLAFGKMIQGSEHTETSGYEITGQHGENIIVNIPETATLVNSVTGTTMPVTITSVIPTILNGEGKANVGITGNIVVDSAQEVGVYTGDLIAAVRYN